jgi:GntR family transcriptional repressor for pyruvate dehydrogenase complex
VAVDQNERVPTYQLLADHLRAQIMSGALRPGDRLPTEPELCARSGVSRSTVREALRLLASQHLIITTRGVTGGSFVAVPDPSLLGDLLSTGLNLLLMSGAVNTEQWFEVRETFEVPAAGLAARRRTDAQLAALNDTLYDSDASDLDTVMAKHLAFHLRLAEATGNPLYELITQPLYEVHNERSLSAQAPPSVWRRADADHRLIVRAVAAGDAAGARAAARAHIEHMRSDYLALRT